MTLSAFILKKRPILGVRNVFKMLGLRHARRPHYLARETCGIILGKKIVAPGKIPPGVAGNHAQAGEGRGAGFSGARMHRAGPGVGALDSTWHVALLGTLNHVRSMRIA